MPTTRFMNKNSWECCMFLGVWTPASLKQVCWICAWMAARTWTEFARRFVGWSNCDYLRIYLSFSQFYIDLLTLMHTAGRDMYVTVWIWKGELHIWIMCVRVMNNTISRLNSGIPATNKTLLGLQRMPSDIRNNIHSMMVKNCQHIQMWRKLYLNTSETTIWYNIV